MLHQPSPVDHASMLQSSHTSQPPTSSPTMPQRTAGPHTRSDSSLGESCSGCLFSRNQPRGSVGSRTPNRHRSPFRLGRRLHKGCPSRRCANCAQVALAARERRRERELWWRSLLVLFLRSWNLWWSSAHFRQEAVFSSEKGVSEEQQKEVTEDANSVPCIRYFYYI